MRSDRPSSTALLIAASTLLSASDARTADLVAPGAADWCRRLLWHRHRLLARSADWAPTGWLWRRLEAWTLPGIQAHYWHRKRWLEQQVRQALAEDPSRQLVVLGAGFDTLGLRLASEIPQLQVLELDHPATQAAKRAALGGAAPPNLSWLALDLARQELPIECLQPDRIVLAEGLLMYLEPAQVQRLLAQLAGVPRLQLLFSYMVRWPDGRAGFRPHSAAVERWLAWRQERFLWALPPAELPALLQGLGLALRAHRSSSELRPPGDPSRLQGEQLVHVTTP